MASQRTAILTAVAGALDGVGKPVGATVHRHRTRPLAADKLPAMVVYSVVPPGMGQAERVDRTDHEGDVERILTVRVEARATGSPTEDAVDALYVWAVKALRTDPTLGGLALDLAERAVSYAADEGEDALAACAVDFEVTYYTTEDDPEVGA